MAEVFNLNHDDEASRKDYNTLGLYLQGAYRINNWKPYYRFDLIDYGGGDPYYAPDDTDIQKHAFGIRWDPITWNCIKLEYSYSERDAANDIHSITLQSGFAFLKNIILFNIPAIRILELFIPSTLPSYCWQLTPNSTRFYFTFTLLKLQDITKDITN